jgi:hypothetical protein
MPRRLFSTRSITIAVVLALGGLGLAVVPAASAAVVQLNVRDFGALGNGTANDTAAIDRAITAANANPEGGVVRFPAGTYRSPNSIHMKSNVTLQLDAGATIMGASGTGYDAPEPNPFSAFQDFGHSHFHDAMIWGDRLTNIGFIGAGTIDGGGNLITGNPSTGHADKIISLTRCSNLTFNGITMRHGGHFAVLINGCNNVTADHFKVLTSSDRDAWNIISTTNVTITNSDIQGNDDAIVFKSDYALGAKLPNGHVRVSDTHASAGCCNALMFGSETCGDFTDYVFERINITGANKSGLGMVSMDGANISDVPVREQSGDRAHQQHHLRQHHRDRQEQPAVHPDDLGRGRGQPDHQRDLHQREHHRAGRQHQYRHRAAEQRPEELQPEQHRYPAGLRLVHPQRQPHHVHEQLGALQQGRLAGGGTGEHRQQHHVRPLHGPAQRRVARLLLPDRQPLLRPEQRQHDRWSAPDHRDRLHVEL